MKIFAAMRRAFLGFAVFAVIGVGGMVAAYHAEHSGNDQVKVTELSRQNISEKLDGKAATGTVLSVGFEPGQEDMPHRHPGSAFVYVLEGEYEHAIDDEPVKKYKAGDVVYEPAGCVHRVARNPSRKNKTRLLAVILHPRDVKEVTVPEKRGQ